MTREQQLEKMVGVLKLALLEAHDLSLEGMELDVRETLLDALAEANRIAAEPVNPADYKDKTNG
jgi:hypothetical protein